MKIQTVRWTHDIYGEDLNTYNYIKETISKLAKIYDYQEIITPIFENTDFFFPYYFYDVQSHIFQNIGENNKISLSWYLGEDNVYNWEELALEALWKNNTFSINYMHMFNEQLKAEFLLAKSRFDIILGFDTIKYKLSRCILLIGSNEICKLLFFCLIITSALFLNI